MGEKGVAPGVGEVGERRQQEGADQSGAAQQQAQRNALLVLPHAWQVFHLLWAPRTRVSL